MISCSLCDVIISCDSSVLRWLHIHSVFSPVTVACVLIWHVLTFLVCNVLYVFSLVI